MKKAVADALCHPFVGRAAGRLLRDRIPNQGIRFDTSDPQVRPRVKAQMLFGLYEKAEIGFIQEHLRGDRDVIELGSSLGVTGSHVLHVLSPDHRLISVEANPELVPVVERAFAHHSEGRSWTVEQAAVSYQPGPTRLRIGATSQGSHVAVEPGDGELVDVPSVTLSDLLARHRVDRFALVCDIEGAEIDLLRCEDEALSRCDQVVIELHPRLDASLDDLRSLLTDRHGFVVVAERGPVLALGRPTSR